MLVQQPLFSQVSATYTPERLVRDIENPQIDLDAKKERVQFIKSSELKLSGEVSNKLLQYLVTSDDDEDLRSEILDLIYWKTVFTRAEDINPIESAVKALFEKHYSDNPAAFDQYNTFIRSIRQRIAFELNLKNREFDTQPQLLYEYIVNKGSESLFLYYLGKGWIDFLCDEVKAIGDDYIYSFNHKGYRFIINQLENGSEEVKLAIITFANRSPFFQYFSGIELINILNIHRYSSDDQLRQATGKLLRRMLHIKTDDLPGFISEVDFDFPAYLERIVSDKTVEMSDRTFAANQIARSYAAQEQKENIGLTTLTRLLEKNNEPEIKTSICYSLINFACMVRCRDLTDKATRVYLNCDIINALPNDYLEWVCNIYSNCLKHRLSAERDAEFRKKTYAELIRRIKDGNADNAIMFSLADLNVNPKQVAEIVLKYVESTFASDLNQLALFNFKRSVEDLIRDSDNDGGFEKAIKKLEQERDILDHKKMEIEFALSPLIKLTRQNHGIDIAAWREAIRNMLE